MWLSMMYRAGGVVVTPFATKELKVAARPSSIRVGRAPQAQADLVDMGLVRQGSKVCVSFANADCLGVMMIVRGTNEPMAYDALAENFDVPAMHRTYSNMTVIGGHVGDAHIEQFCDVVASHLSAKSNQGVRPLQPSEIYIVRGRSLIKRWFDGIEENAADRLARLIKDSFPSTTIKVAGTFSELNPAAFPTSHVREATKSFLDLHNIAPELGDNLLERLKKMPPALTPAYHEATNGIDFGDRHALVMELTV